MGKQGKITDPNIKSGKIVRAHDTTFKVFSKSGGTSSARTQMLNRATNSSLIYDDYDYFADVYDILMPHAVQNVGGPTNPFTQSPRNNMYDRNPDIVFLGYSLDGVNMSAFPYDKGLGQPTELPWYLYFLDADDNATFSTGTISAASTSTNPNVKDTITTDQNYGGTANSMASYLIEITSGEFVGVRRAIAANTTGANSVVSIHGRWGTTVPAAGDQFKVIGKVIRSQENATMMRTWLKRFRDNTYNLVIAEQEFNDSTTTPKDLYDTIVFDTAGWGVLTMLTDKPYFSMTRSKGNEFDNDSVGIRLKTWIDFTKDLISDVAQRLRNDGYAYNVGLNAISDGDKAYGYKPNGSLTSPLADTLQIAKLHDMKVTWAEQFIHGKTGNATSFPTTASLERDLDMVIEYGKINKLGLMTSHLWPKFNPTGNITVAANGLTVTSTTYNFNGSGFNFSATSAIGETNRIWVYSGASWHSAEVASVDSNTQVTLATQLPAGTYQATVGTDPNETSYWGISSTNSMSKRWFKYSWAAFLVAHNGSCAMQFRDDSPFVTATENILFDGDRMFGRHIQRPQNYYDGKPWIFHLQQLGEPVEFYSSAVEARITADDYYHDSGVVGQYARRFEKGIIYLNATNADYSVNLPTAEVYEDIDGTFYSGTITVPKYSALILKSTNTSTKVPLGLMDNGVTSIANLKEKNKEFIQNPKVVEDFVDTFKALHSEKHTTLDDNDINAAGSEKDYQRADFGQASRHASIDDRLTIAQRLSRKGVLTSTYRNSGYVQQSEREEAADIERNNADAILWWNPSGLEVKVGQIISPSDGTGASAGTTFEQTRFEGGGYVNSIDARNGKVVVGCDVAGIWVSSDNGDTWKSKIKGIFPATRTYTNSVHIDPYDNDIIYAAAGINLATGTFLISTDGGLTFTKVNNDTLPAGKLRIQSGNNKAYGEPDALFNHTPAWGTDYGDFSQVYNGIRRYAPGVHPRSVGQNIAVSRNATGAKRLWLGCNLMNLQGSPGDTTSAGGGIRYSDNSGVTWTQAADGDIPYIRSVVYYEPTDTIFFAAYDVGLFKIESAGTTATPTAVLLSDVISERYVQAMHIIEDKLYMAANAHGIRVYDITNNTWSDLSGELDLWSYTLTNAPAYNYATKGPHSTTTVSGVQYALMGDNGIAFFNASGVDKNDVAIPDININQHDPSLPQKLYDLSFTDEDGNVYTTVLKVPAANDANNPLILKSCKTKPQLVGFMDRGTETGGFANPHPLMLTTAGPPTTTTYNSSLDDYMQGTVFGGFTIDMKWSDIQPTNSPQLGDTGTTTYTVAASSSTNYFTYTTGTAPTANAPVQITASAPTNFNTNEFYFIRDVDAGNKRFRLAAYVGGPALAVGSNTTGVTVKTVGGGKSLIDYAIWCARKWNAQADPDKTLRINLRIKCGRWSPAWVRSITGSYYEIDTGVGSNTTPTAVETPKWWTQLYMDEYDRLMSLVSATYDKVPEIAQVIVAGTGPNYPEAFVRHISSQDALPDWTAQSYSKYDVVKRNLSGVVRVYVAIADALSTDQPSTSDTAKWKILAQGNYNLGQVLWVQMIGASYNHGAPLDASGNLLPIPAQGWFPTSTYPVNTDMWAIRKQWEIHKNRFKMTRSLTTFNPLVLAKAGTYPTPPTGSAGTTYPDLTWSEMAFYADYMGPQLGTMGNFSVNLDRSYHQKVKAVATSTLPAPTGNSWVYNDLANVSSLWTAGHPSAASPPGTYFGQTDYDSCGQQWHDGHTGDYGGGFYGDGTWSVIADPTGSGKGNVLSLKTTDTLNDIRAFRWKELRENRDAVIEVECYFPSSPAPLENSAFFNLFQVKSRSRTNSGGATTATTNLNGAIDANVSSIVVDSSASFPATTSFIIQIDSEKMLVTAGHGTTTLSVTRGYLGTTKATHSDNAVVTWTQRNDPVWALYGRNDGAGGIKLEMGYGWGSTILPGPFSNSTPSSTLGRDPYGRWYKPGTYSDNSLDTYGDQTGADLTLPVGQWFTIRMQILQASDYTGSLRIWINDVLYWTFNNVVTSYWTNAYGNAWNGDGEWAVCNYHDGTGLATCLVYFDNAEIFSNDRADAGAGAYLELASNGALPLIDGVSLINGDKILVAGDSRYNGVYEVTSVGSGSTKAKLTRSADFDEGNASPPNYTGTTEVHNGCKIYVTDGLGTFSTNGISVNNSTNTFTKSSGHTLTNGSRVQITSNPPSSLTTGTSYYVVNATSTSFQLAASMGGAVLSVGTPAANPVVVSRLTNRARMFSITTADPIVVGFTPLDFSNQSKGFMLDMYERLQNHYANGHAVYYQTAGRGPMDHEWSKIMQRAIDFGGTAIEPYNAFYRSDNVNALGNTIPWFDVATMETHTTAMRAKNKVSAGQVREAVFVRNQPHQYVGNSIAGGPFYTSVTGYLDTNTDEHVLYAGTFSNKSASGSGATRKGRSLWKSTNTGTNWDYISVHGDNSISLDITTGPDDKPWWLKTKHENFMLYGDQYTSSRLVVDEYSSDKYVWSSGRSGFWRFAEASDTWKPMVYRVGLTVNRGIAASKNFNGTFYNLNTDYAFLQSNNSGDDVYIAAPGTLGADNGHCIDVRDLGTSEEIIVGFGNRDSNIGGEIWAKTETSSTNTDKNATWTSENWSLPNRIIGIATGVDGSTNRVVLAVAEADPNDSAAKKANAGIWRKVGNIGSGTWTKVLPWTSIDGSGNYIDPTKLYPLVWPGNQGQYVYYYDRNFGIYRSADYGLTWEQIVPVSLLTGHAQGSDAAYLIADPNTTGLLFLTYSQSGANRTKVIKITGAHTSSRTLTDVTASGMIPGPTTIDPDGYLLIAAQGDNTTDAAIWKSTTTNLSTITSSTWQNITIGVPDYAQSSASPKGICVTLDGTILISDNGMGITSISSTSDNNFKLKLGATGRTKPSSPHPSTLPVNYYPLVPSTINPSSGVYSKSTTEYLSPIRIGNEIILMPAYDPSDWTLATVSGNHEVTLNNVVRGAFNTTPATHDATGGAIPVYIPVYVGVEEKDGRPLHHGPTRKALRYALDPASDATAKWVARKWIQHFENNAPVTTADADWASWWPQTGQANGYNTFHADVMTASLYNMGDGWGFKQLGNSEISKLATTTTYTNTTWTTEVLNKAAGIKKYFERGGRSTTSTKPPFGFDVKLKANWVTPYGDATLNTQQNRLMGNRGTAIDYGVVERFLNGIASHTPSLTNGIQQRFDIESNNWNAHLWMKTSTLGGSFWAPAKASSAVTDGEKSQYRLFCLGVDLLARRNFSSQRLLMSEWNLPAVGSKAEAVLEGPFKFDWGKAVGPIDPTGLASFGSVGSAYRPATDVYVREFDKGIVAVNVGATDVAAVSIPGRVREINTDGTLGDYLGTSGAPAQDSINLAFFYNTVTAPATDAEMASKNDLLIYTKNTSSGNTNTSRDVARAAGKPVLQYVLFTEVLDNGTNNNVCWDGPGGGSDNFPSVVGKTFADFVAGTVTEYPGSNEWFLRTANNSVIKTGVNYFMDPGHTGYQQFFIDRVLNLWQTRNQPWDGIFLDNVFRSLGTGTNATNATGLKLKSWTAQADGNGAVYNHAGVQYNDTTYRAAVASMLENLKTQLKAAYPTRPIWGNVCENGSITSYLPHLDGVMLERCFTGWKGENKTASTSTWNADRALIEEIQTAGVDVLCVAFGFKDNNTLQQFALASYLLFSEDNAYFRYTDNAYSQFWDYANYAQPMGLPLGAKYSIGTNIWRRDFTHGSVVVDANSRTASITYAVNPTAAIPKYTAKFFAK